MNSYVPVPVLQVHAHGSDPLVQQLSARARVQHPRELVRRGHAQQPRRLHVVLALTLEPSHPPCGIHDIVKNTISA